MKYFIDTEFIENGRTSPIQLVSIGIVSESGREYYAVSNEYDPATASDWVKQNVFPFLCVTGIPVRDIASSILKFVRNTPEFWGYYADYDWVVFCQIFGKMIDLPKGWPMYCRDIKQLCDLLGNPKLPPQGATEHNALEDARWNLMAYKFLENMKTK